MPYIVKQNFSNHDFVKQNLVTLSKGGKYYDAYKCACGVEGKSYTIGVIEIPKRFSEHKVNDCPLYEPQKSHHGKQIRIKRCPASGKAFRNLTDSSIHTVIPAPEKEKMLELAKQGQVKSSKRKNGKEDFDKKRGEGVLETVRLLLGM